MASDFDPKSSALRNLKRAVKQSNVVDEQGRKVPAYIYVGDESGENQLWSEIAITPQPVMQRAVINLKRKGVQTLVKSQVIVDSYNDNYNQGEWIQLGLEGLEDEVLEGALMRKNPHEEDEN